MKVRRSQGSHAAERLSFVQVGGRRKHLLTGWMPGYAARQSLA
jgi:hypothetical protein